MESRVLKTSRAFWMIAAFVVERALSCASVKALAFGFVVVAGLGFAAREV
jgi:hypothetical protein